MKENARISVVYKHPGQDPKLVVIPNTLEALQTLVGGYVEEVSWFWGTEGQPFTVFGDEEGRLKQKPDNIIIYYDWTFDFIVGDIVIVRTENHEIVDLTPNDFEDAVLWLEDMQ